MVEYVGIDGSGRGTFEISILSLSEFIYLFSTLFVEGVCASYCIASSDWMWKEMILGPF
jgi:hypothetical protein